MIRRERVLQIIGDAPALAVVAPSGYGKTTLLDQWVAHRPAIRIVFHAADAAPTRVRSRLADAAAEHGVTVSVDSAPDEFAHVFRRAIPADSIVTFDDIHHLDDDAASALLDIVGELRSAQVRVAVSGRRAPWTLPEAVAIGASDLAFDLVETIALVAPAVDADRVEVAQRCRRATNGWPAASDMWARATETDPGATVGDVLDHLMSGIFASFSPRHRSLIGALPLVSNDLGAEVGWPTMVDDLIRCGLPVRVHNEWHVVGDVARDRLLTSRPQGDDVRRCARYYATHRQLTFAVDLLCEFDDVDHLPSLLDNLSPTACDNADLDELIATLHGSSDAGWQAAPGGPLAVARAAESRARHPVRATILDRLGRLALDGVHTLQVEVERVRDAAMEGRIDDAIGRGQQALSSLGSADVIAKVRCLYGLGWAASLRDDAASLLQAAAWFAESAGLAKSARRSDDRARALSALAYRVHLKRAEFDRAINRFEEALALIADGSHHRAATLSFLAETLVHVGRDADALEALDEARIIARRCGDTRMIAYCAWAAAKVASRQRNTAVLHHWLDDAAAHPGDWFAHLTGAEFCAVAAELCAQCNDEEGATRWLQQALTHPRIGEYPDISWAAECSIATHFGDPVEGERLIHRLLTEGYTVLGDRWRYWVWIAWCRHRAGNLTAAAEATDHVIRLTTALGYPNLPDLHEPEMWATLQAADSPHVADTVMRVHVLGDFVIRRGDVAVELAGGKPQQLVKILAVMARPITVDEMAELLWPEAEAEVGRRRLRNVVARVRAAGDLLERNDDLLALNGAIPVDLQDFEVAAQAAMRSDVAHRGDRAHAALALYSGELLPSDRYEEWTVTARERTRALASRLAEAAFDAAAESSDAAAASLAAERLLALDPFADHVAERMAEVLTVVGAKSSATTWLARAQRIRTDLGF